MGKKKLGHQGEHRPEEEPRRGSSVMGGNGYERQRNGGPTAEAGLKGKGTGYKKVRQKNGGDPRGAGNL